jgi:hypothetical protein
MTSNVIRFPRPCLRVVDHAKHGLPDTRKPSDWREWQDFSTRSFANGRDLMTAYGELCCQAFLTAADTADLFFKACDVSLGFHAKQPMRGEPKCRTETPSAEFAVPIARKLQPDEPA